MQRKLKPKILQSKEGLSRTLAHHSHFLSLRPQSNNLV